MDTEKNVRKYSRTVLVTLPDWLWEKVEGLRGEMGGKNSEIIRNITMAYLSEHGHLDKKK
jgi:metal-responsive CopG/Arc/MetJ family transcriptional regulator